MEGKQHCAQVVPDQELGGASLIAIKLASKPPVKDWSFSFWSPQGGQVASRVREMGIDSRPLERNILFNQSRLRSLGYNLQVGRKLRFSGASVAHLHCPYLYSALRHGLKWSGLKRIVHVHNDISSVELDRLLKVPPDVTIACAGFLADRIKEIIPPNLRQSSKVECVRNSVDLATYDAENRTRARRALALSKHQVMLLIVADIAKHKGHRTAIRALAELRSREIAVELWIAGTERNSSGGETESLQKLCDELALTPHVRFCGYRKDIPTLMTAADAVLLPSIREGLPLVVLEAQAARTPILASPTSGIPEVIEHGRTGFLIESDDSLQYANQIQWLLTNPRQRDEITEAAYEYVCSEHSWDTYRSRMMNIYRELME